MRSRSLVARVTSPLEAKQIPLAACATGVCWTTSDGLRVITFTACGITFILAQRLEQRLLLLLASCVDRRPTVVCWELDAPLRRVGDSEAPRSGCTVSRAIHHLAADAAQLRRQPAVRDSRNVRCWRDRRAASGHGQCLPPCGTSCSRCRSRSSVRSGTGQRVSPLPATPDRVAGVLIGNQKEAANRYTGAPLRYRLCSAHLAKL